MLSDREAEEIERGRREKTGGPVVLRWVERLLEDRRERIQQVEYLQRRLNQAFRYLERLVRDARHPPGKPLPCPKCGKPYERATGFSPSGIVYCHRDGTQCAM